MQLCASAQSELKFQKSECLNMKKKIISSWAVIFKKYQ
jgi:hypothetical protein